jgi:hypothetical protein
LRQQFVLVTIAKFFVAGLNVLFVYLCMSRLDRGEAAAFFAQYSAIMLLSAFCGLGAGVAAFSIVSPANNRGENVSRDYTALLLVGLGGIVAAGLLYAVLVALPVFKPINPSGTGFFLVGAALTLLMADLNRAGGDIALSILLQGAGPMLILLAAITVLDIHSADDLFNCAAVAYTVSAASLLVTGRRHLGPVPIAEIARKARVAVKAAPFPAVSSMQVHAEIVLGSLFLGPAVLPVFVVANRMATLVKMPALIAFRVFAPSMDSKLAARLAFQDGDRSFGWRLFWAGAMLLGAGLAALPVAEYLGLVALPAGFYEMFVVCAGIKLGGLLLGSPESLLVAEGRFMSTYVSAVATLLAVAAVCWAVAATTDQYQLLIVGLVSSWFVLQRGVMLWSSR